MGVSMPSRIVLILATVATLCLAGCGEGPAPESAAPRLPADLEGAHDVAVLTLEGMGEIRIELLPEIAPGTVEIFTRLVESGAYDGTTFHRVIPDFMIQGGSPSTRKKDPRNHGRGGHADFPDEFSDVTHARGAIALANRGRKNTAAGQFYIVLKDSPQLDGRFTVFGRVASGMEVADAIAAMEIDTYGRHGPQNRPYPRDARIVSIRMDPASGGQ